MRIPGSVTDAELAAVEMIATAMGRVPAQPACPGPLLVHADGAIECHGDSCPGAMAIFHSDDVVESCALHPEIQTLHACPSCLPHSGGAGLTEHTCAGQRIEHDDGKVDCTAGDACLGERAIHATSRRCRMLGPCPRNCQPALLPPGIACPALRHAFGPEAPASPEARSRVRGSSPRR